MSFEPATRRPVSPFLQERSGAWPGPPNAGWTVRRGPEIRGPGIPVVPHPRVAGEPIRITFTRGDRTIEECVALEFSQTPSGQLVRPASARYSGFAKAVATDLYARPEHCGAPVVDSHGRVLGMLIARAPFVKSLVLPSEQLARALEQMLAQVHRAK